ncbi:hypothetical protein [Williamsia sp. M5A3_1d]
MRRHVIGLTTGVVGAAAAALAWGGGGLAGAAPLVIDPAVPPNGIAAPGYPRGPLLTPPGSPIQLPTPTVTDDGDRTFYRSYPFFADWFHRAVPVPSHTALDAAGGVELTVTDPVTHRTVDAGVAGHCLFVGRGLPADPASDPAVRTIRLPSIRVDTGILKISIDPTAFVSADR